MSRAGPGAPVASGGQVPVEIGAYRARTYYTQDELGRLIRVDDPEGNSVGTDYDSEGRVRSTWTPLGLLASYSYDPVGQMTAFQDGVGRVTTYHYDPAGQQTAVEDPTGARTSFAYNRVGERIGQTNALDETTTTLYDATGRVKATVDGLGYRTTYSYDAGGMLYSVEDPLGGLTRITYDQYDHPWEITYPDGVVVTRIWGLSGINFESGGFLWGVHAEVDPLGRATSFQYTLRGDLWMVQNPLGAFTTYGYDYNRNRVQTVDALAHFSTVLYNGLNLPYSSEDANGHTTLTTYDLAARPIAVTDPLEHATRTAYDAANRPTTHTNALDEATRTDYDLNNRPTAVTNPLGEVTTTIYDDVARTVAREDPLGRRTTTQYDALGRAVAVTDPLGYTVTTTYDAAGRPVALTDGRGKTTTTLYDAVGRVVGSIDPLGQRTTYAYDWSGYRALVFDPSGRVVPGSAGSPQPLQRTDARGRETNYTLDALNRPLVTAYSDGTRVTRTWDPAGRLTAVKDAEGISTTTYDPVGRVTEVVNPYGQSLSYSYDNVGNRLLTQDPSGTLTTYTYDNVNQVTEITNPFGEVTAIEYDELGREKRKVLANGMAVSHTYDEAGRQTLLAQYKADGTPLAVYTATYDRAGNRTQVEELDGAVVSYSYDAAGQLTREQRSGANAYDTTYTYDPAGNRLTKGEAAGTTAYDYDAANQLLVVTPPEGPATTHTWDAAGNLHVENCGGALTTYTWDDDNRLVGVSHPDGRIETHTYDPASGLRRKKETPGAGRIFVWQGQNVLVETDLDLVVQAEYTDLPGEWGGLASQRRGDVSSFFGFDLQSSTRLLVSVGGEVTDVESYKAFGESLASSGTTEHPFRYVGEQGYEWEEDDRYYVRARHLDVADGRWLSRDPIGFEGGTNLYAYVGNSPVSRLDPRGLQQTGAGYPPEVGRILAERGADQFLALSRLLDRAAGLREPEEWVGYRWVAGQTFPEWDFANRSIQTFLLHYMPRDLADPLGARAFAEAAVQASAAGDDIVRITVSHVAEDLRSGNLERILDSALTLMDVGLTLAGLAKRYGTPGSGVLRRPTGLSQASHSGSAAPVPHGGSPLAPSAGRPTGSGLKPYGTAPLPGGAAGSVVGERGPSTAALTIPRQDVIGIREALAKAIVPEVSPGGVPLSVHIRDRILFGAAGRQPLTAGDVDLLLRADRVGSVSYNPQVVRRGQRAGGEVVEEILRVVRGGPTRSSPKPELMPGVAYHGDPRMGYFRRGTITVRAAWNRGVYVVVDEATGTAVTVIVPKKATIPK